MRVPVVALAIAALAAAACSKAPADPIALDRNFVTVDNRTSQAWTGVEIWVNMYYRVTAESIPPGGRFQAPLDTFVSGFGQRFDFRRMQIRDLRLTARLPDGKPLELKKQFAGSGLGGALDGLKGK